MNLIDPTLIYLKASFATTAKTYQSLPSEFIFFSSFTMVKPGFCAKISSQISDPQKTTVQGIGVANWPRILSSTEYFGRSGQARLAYNQFLQ